MNTNNIFIDYSEKRITGVTEEEKIHAYSEYLIKKNNALSGNIDLLRNYAFDPTTVKYMYLLSTDKNIHDNKYLDAIIQMKEFNNGYAYFDMYEFMMMDIMLRDTLLCMIQPQFDETVKWYNGIKQYVGHEYDYLSQPLDTYRNSDIVNILRALKRKTNLFKLGKISSDKYMSPANNSIIVVNYLMGFSAYKIQTELFTGLDRDYDSTENTTERITTVINDMKQFFIDTCNLHTLMTKISTDLENLKLMTNVLFSPDNLGAIDAKTHFDLLKK